AVTTMRTGEPATDRIFGKSTFELWRDSPHAFDVELDFFKDRTTVLAPRLVDAYDFSAFSRVVEVGGSTGALLAPLLCANPRLRGTVVDLPHVVGRAGPLLREAGVLDRCTIVGGDFFTSVPTGGDLYLLQNVIHDWGNAQATTILRSCRAAMPSTGVLLLVE